MHLWFRLILTLLLIPAAPGFAEEMARWDSTIEIAAPEAVQAAAADEHFVYAIASRQIAKYDRKSGKRISVSTGNAKHLNSGFLWNGQLLCAHSNYPQTPEISEIKSLNPKTMKLTTFRNFGNYGGSLVWVIRHNKHWWCNFAHYGDQNSETFLARFNDDWKETGRWTFPESVIRQLGSYSLSGGLWFGDDLLVTGHDRQELYRLKLPASGSVLQFVGREEVPFTGQGIAIDLQADGLVGISRADRKIIFAKRAIAESDKVSMPSRGICAHRGASDTHPENTLAAFREAIRLGAHMIEFDVALTADGQLVLMHDTTLDRTTDGSELVSNFTLAELKKLDAGSWKHAQFKGQRIPTLQESLSIMPENIWLNVHLKGGAELAAEVTKQIVAADRLHQSFLACGQKAVVAAKEVDDRIQICNMERQANSLEYVDDTIGMRAEFIQLYGGNAVDPDLTARLQEHGVRINYCCANDSQIVADLFEAGAEFPLVDRLEPMLKVADQNGIPRLQPIYRSRLKHDGLANPLSKLVEQRPLKDGAASQGLALTKSEFFTSTADSIFRYDTDWNLLQQKTIQIPGVNHVGAIDYHDGFLWAGLLHGPEGGKHDPKLNRSVIAKIRAKDLSIVQTWDISKDVTWIDPVCFDGRHLWVGDLSDMGIHRYRFEADKIERDGVFRYPQAMHFSQGIRIEGNRMYSMHTFGSMDGLFEFDLPEKLTDEIQQPRRVWHITESRMHPEGFDFIPGRPNQIWHAQGKQIDRYELKAMDLQPGQ